MTRAQHLVDRPARLPACVEDIARSPRIGLDTESNGFHAYFEKVCLLQIATPDADWAVDPLAVTTVRKVSPAIAASRCGWSLARSYPIAT